MRNIQQNEIALVSGAYNPGYPGEPGPTEPPFVWPWPLPTAPYPWVQPNVVPYGP